MAQALRRRSRYFPNDSHNGVLTTFHYLRRQWRCPYTLPSCLLLNISVEDRHKFRMAATLVLLLAMSTLLTTRVEMKEDSLVYLEVDSGNSEENLFITFQNRSIIPRGFSGKKVGTSTFFAVLREPDLARMNLKDVNEITPVIQLEERIENLKVWWPLHRDINNTELWLFKVSPILKGQTLQQYEAELKHLIRTVASVKQTFCHRVYISKGSFPPKFYIFVNKEKDLFKAFINALNIFGGPGSTNVEASYVHILLR